MRSARPVMAAPGEEGQAQVPMAAIGGQGGTAGGATVENNGLIAVTGDLSQGIVARSLGGAGGDGGDSDGGFVSRGGAAQGPGPGGPVMVNNSSDITTDGFFSRGIFAQSVGGFAGSGGSASGLVAFGANGNSGGDGGTVNIDNTGTVVTSGPFSMALFAQSVGGGGGSGGASGGLVALGGDGDAGGNGGDVTVAHSGELQTADLFSTGIFAQSVGGGGGDGGDASAGGLISVAIGGKAAAGGDGGHVSVTGSDMQIDTTGNLGIGILAQSVGGGGGNGGYATGVSIFPAISCSVALGGDAGGGGDGGQADIDLGSNSVIQTSGDNAFGIFAESLGGGGGSGGASLAGTASTGVSVSVALGGNGGDGGSGSGVNVTTAGGKIETTGTNSHGILALSVGGGGGTAGASSTANVGGGLSVGVSIGGTGGDGGTGGEVYLTNNNRIDTSGDFASGLLAQSVGGGGGNAGFSAAGSVGLSFEAGVSIGGSGGSGGIGGDVHLKNYNKIDTSGILAFGILAQSIGGGGGNGGYSVAGTAGTGTSVGVSIGGSGGSGGDSGQVDVTNKNDISTSGILASGITAQSLGGGGGNGGFSVAGSVGSLPIDISIGGSGDVGGVGGLLNVENNGDIATFGEVAYGIFAQSLGGGGGSGGYSASADAGIASFAFSLGGSGDGGGMGGMVNLKNLGNIATHATGSHGILAQSLGGGGGAGGWAGSAAMGFGFQVEDISIPGGSLAIALGGKGGTGGDAQKVTINNSGSIVTDQVGSGGIMAESIGGGGGDGGWAAAAAGSVAAGETFTFSVSVAHGGTGGDGGYGGEVEVVNSGAIHTKAENAPGILSQSLGGGGGNGGASAAVTIEAGTEDSSSFGAAVSIGGSGGLGGRGHVVSVTSSNTIQTEGDASYGINAQSVGGGGGNGGASITGDISLTQGISYQMEVSVGGSGDFGGPGGPVTADSTANITTAGDQAVGILAQSIGGGGGNGGLSFNGQFTVGDTNNISVSIGGSGKGGGNGGDVRVTAGAGGSVYTFGTDAHGILAQSVGGGGGRGNLGGSMALSYEGGGDEDGSEESMGLTLNIGGAGGLGGTGRSVNVINDSGITTANECSYGILAQSIGGGGGAAGGTFTGELGAEMPGAGSHYSFTMAIGGRGGAGGNGGSVQVQNHGIIHTTGYRSHGIFAQSVGGGGGVGGDAKDFSLKVTEPGILPDNFTGLVISVGGKGGVSGNGDTVEVANSSSIITEGEYSKGILAQSIGGGGGDGGSNKGYTLRDVVIPSFFTISVGGSEGSNGNGGDVTVTNSGIINTSGEGSDAIFAQSVGGGGGIGGEGELGLLKPGIGIGGAAGAGGNGGKVNVKNSGGIHTVGDGAHGIFAQSVGGGGGRAGNVARFDFGSASIGLGIGFAREGGAGGDGGQVTVTNTANISIEGESAYGIFAQSVGGGGGEAGEVGIGEGAVINYLLGSVGDAGYGAAVSVSHSVGVIATSGDKSNGIFAQSAGGEGNTGGAVDISVFNDIISSGTDSNGILAQSIGPEGNGDICIIIGSGKVQGGPGGSGVVFMDGAYNTLNNRGTVTTLDGIIGSAVKSIESDIDTFNLDRGNETINNYGTIIGSVNLGGGRNTFNNYQSGAFDAGSTSTWAPAILSPMKAPLLPAVLKELPLCLPAIFCRPAPALSKLHFTAAEIAVNCRLLEKPPWMALSSCITIQKNPLLQAYL